MVSPHKVTGRAKSFFPLHTVQNNRNTKHWMYWREYVWIGYRYRIGSARHWYIRTYTLHSPDLCFIRVLVQVVEVLPPLEQHRVADEFEPRSEAQALVLEHLFQLICRDVLVSLGFIRVYVEVDIGLDE